MSKGQPGGFVTEFVVLIRTGRRPTHGYEACLTSIESTLKLLVNLSNAARQLQSRNAESSVAPVVRAADDSYTMDVATLGQGKADLTDNSEELGESSGYYCRVEQQ